MDLKSSVRAYEAHTGQRQLVVRRLVNSIIEGGVTPPHTPRYPGTPQQHFGTPQRQVAATFGTPQQQFGTPQRQVAAPFGTPQQHFGTPQRQVAAPFGTPQQQQHFGTPQQHVAAPFGTPQQQQHFGTPQQHVGTPPRASAPTPDCSLLVDPRFALGNARQSNVFCVPYAIAKRYVRLPHGTTEVMVKKIIPNPKATSKNNSMVEMSELEAIRTVSRYGIGPHIYGYVKCDDGAILVLMQKLPGIPLIDYIQRHKGNISGVIKGIYDIIDRMAQVGLYHKDLNFDNIFVNPIGIIDFGMTMAINYSFDGPLDEASIKKQMAAAMKKEVSGRLETIQHKLKSE
jgi:tRNA A-37 threonylcarbamoyl transferase component Bud32